MQEVLRRTVLLRILLTIGARPFKDIEKIVLVQKPNGIRLGYLKRQKRGGFTLFCATRRNGSFSSTRMNEEAEIDIIVNED